MRVAKEKVVHCIQDRTHENDEKKEQKERIRS